MAQIVEHLSVEDLEQRYRAAQDATKARHTQVIPPKRAAQRDPADLRDAAGLLAQGRGVLEVAGVLAFAPRGVEQLAARCNAHGPEALGDQRRRNGRAASVLIEAALQALADRQRTPSEDGGRWIGAEVALWMAGRLGMEQVRPQRGWEALRRVRRRKPAVSPWSIQASRPRHPRSTAPEQQAEFRRGSTRPSRKSGQRTPASRSKSAKSQAICAGPLTRTALA